MKITKEVTIGNKYEINLHGHDRHGQVVTVFHDSAAAGTEIIRTHCIVEDETGHRFIIRKMCLTPEMTQEEAELLYEFGYWGQSDDDNHIGSGDSSINNHE